MKLSWLFNLGLLLAAAAAMLPRIAGAQDVPSTQSAGPAEPARPDPLILEASKALGDYVATTRPVVDTPTLSNTEIEKSFDDLASTEPEARQAARLSLLGLTRDQLPVLQEIVRSAAPIAPAQAAALREIVAHVYLAGEPYQGGNSGFMGVMLPPPPQGGLQIQLVPAPLPPQGGDDAADADDGDAGVTIQDCMPGFCGYRYLRPGDLIIGIQAAAAAPAEVAGAPAAPAAPAGPAGPAGAAPDRFLRTTTDRTLITEVSAHPPGSPLTLRLIRQGHMIDVTLLLSAKPKVLEFVQHEHDVDEWREGRLKMAEDYWQTAFEPLLRPHVS